MDERPSRRRLLMAGVAASVSLLASFAPRLWAGSAESFKDPLPPTPADLPPQAPAARQKNPDATFHADPKPLPAGATTGDWPCFLGPSHNEVSIETKLLDRFPKGGPAVVWEVKKGDGYSASAVAGDRLILFHRVGNEEVTDCLHATTGERYWHFARPCAYRDRYGYSDGPRAAPSIVTAIDSVFTLGVDGRLQCLELSTGRARWGRDLLTEFGLKQNFFGVGTSPLVEGDKLIVNVGAPDGPSVAAFDLKTGKMLWGAGKEWGPSYASPIPATVNGKRRIFVFAGGETRPRARVTGGLLCIDPADGAVDFTFPWRGDRRESVNASSPLVLGNQVFISECYGSGGTLLDVLPDGSCRQVWKNESFGTHFMLAVQKDGHLYGVDGHGPNDAFLVCVDLKTGKELWRTQPEWEETLSIGRQTTAGTYRAWLMPVDGRCLCLGEFGHLLWIDLNPQGYKELDRTPLFAAGETWTPPVLSRGLLYINQNTPERAGGKPPRLACYDLRA